MNAALPSRACDTPPQERTDWREVLTVGGRWSPLVTLASSPERVARLGGGRIHLSAPYFSEAVIRDQWRMERSVRASMFAAIEVARLAALGCCAVAPAMVIAGVAEAGALLDAPPDPLDLRFWAEWSQPLLSGANMVVVPDIDGWRRCPLVWRDVAFALEHNVPVHVYGAWDE